MIETNIDLLTEEALRLIEASLSLTCDIESSISLPEESSLKIDLIKNKEILENEKQKLVNKEMVLAVVGTMKAGKSTTINAIVGTEVLPSRNRPMTALPTLIRHKKGVITPKLYPQNLKPIHSLCKVLAKKFKSGSKPNSTVDVDEDMELLISQINDGTAFNKSLYEGEGEIFDYLKGLNDLVRLSGAMGTGFPYDEYKKVNQVPLIEVEFSHLAEFDNNKGQISILDTPGPNESDQPYLKSMLEEQLSKASAVISVMDYTQLRSTADADVRHSLFQIPKNLPLYVMVNKFDQRDRNGDNEEQIKKLVSEQLMDGRVTANEVFPVSSMQAYLSNRAKRHIDSFGKLPDHQTESWVGDFGEEALGRKWKKEIEDISEVTAATKELWQESMFSKPMKDVLHHAHANSAKFAIKSVIEKINALTVRYNREFSMMHQGATQELDVLKGGVIALKDDVNKLKVAETEIESHINSVITEIISETNKTARNIEKNLKKQITKYFKEGNAQEFEKKVIARDEEIRLKKQQEESLEKDRLRGLLKSLAEIVSKNAKSRTNGEKDFDPDATVINFTDRQDASNFLLKLEESTASIMMNGQESLKEALSESLDTLNKEINFIITDEIEPIKSHIEDELKLAGFKIELNLPTMNHRGFPVSVNKVFNSAVQEKSKQERHFRRKNNWVGRICSWFNTDDWGWESYEVTVQFYEVDLRQIKKKADKQLTEFIKAIDNSIHISIEEPVKKEVNGFFEDFGKILDAVVSNIEVSIANTNLDSQEKERLLSSLELGLQQNAMIRGQNHELNEELEGN